MICSQFKIQISFQVQNCICWYAKDHYRQHCGLCGECLDGSFNQIPVKLKAKFTKEFLLLTHYKWVSHSENRKREMNERAGCRMSTSSFWLASVSRSLASCNCYGVFFRLVAVVDWRSSHDLVTQKVKKLWIVDCCCISLWFIRWDCSSINTHFECWVSGIWKGVIFQ